jgi:hypothetical protein
MKKRKHADIDLNLAGKLGDLSPELLKAVTSAPVQKESRQRTRKRKAQSTQEQTSVTNRIYEELEQPNSFALGEARRLLSDMILPPYPKLAWTQTLDGYEDARISAENAMRRIWAGTEAARAGTKGDPWLDVCLYKVRTGRIQIGSPEISRCMLHAERIGKGRWFFERLHAEFKNAEKRVPGASQFSKGRVELVIRWLRSGFWLMSDDLIARFLYVSREAIRKSVKELQLVKHHDTGRAPIIKGLDENGMILFRQGYPATF